jgi:antitoxin component YwqK of YwqJK toxin-antitoxin module
MKSSIPLLVLCLAACGGNGKPSTVNRTLDSLAAAARADSLRKVAAIDSLRDGPHTYRDENGQPLLEGELRGGKRHGVWTAFGPGGRVKSRSEYVDGVLEGPTIVFHENGALFYQGQHLHGMQNGEWKFFDEKNQLLKIVHFDSAGSVINDH